MYFQPLVRDSWWLRFKFWASPKILRVLPFLRPFFKVYVPVGIYENPSSGCNDQGCMVKH